MKIIDTITVMDEVQEDMADAELELWWDFIDHREDFIKKMSKNPKELEEFLMKVLKREHSWWKKLHYWFCDACGVDIKG